MSDSKKIIVKPEAKPKLKQGGQVVLPDSQQLLADALTIMSNELARFSFKTTSGRSLDLKESRIVQGYVKCFPVTILC